MEDFEKLEAYLNGCWIKRSTHSALVRHCNSEGNIKIRQLVRKILDDWAKDKIK